MYKRQDLRQFTSGTKRISLFASDVGITSDMVHVDVKINVQELIEGYFQKYLHRASQSTGMNFYLDSYKNGSSLRSIENSIKNSNEAHIYNYYMEYLGRAPDQAGMVYYRDTILGAGQTTLAQVEDAIKNSPEAQIRSIYLDVLNREPDAGGMAFYLGKHESGEMTIPDIRADIEANAASGN